MGLGPSFPDRAAQAPPICPADTSAADNSTTPGVPLGVARARAAASEALRTSLDLAQGRVEYLEKLISDVNGGSSGGGSGGGIDDCSADASAPSDRKEAVGIDRDEAREMTEAATSTTVGDATRGADPASSQPRDSKLTSSEVRSDNEDTAKTTGVDSDGGASSDAATVASGERAQQAKATCDSENTLLPAVQSDTQPATPSHHLDLSIGAKGKRNNSRNRGGGGRAGRGFAGQQGLRAKGNGNEKDVAAALEEAKSWRMASQRAEASLADLRETLGDVLALSFRCGEQHGRLHQNNSSNPPHRDSTKLISGGVVVGESGGHSSSSVSRTEDWKRSGGVESSAAAAAALGVRASQESTQQAPAGGEAQGVVDPLEGSETFVGASSTSGTIGVQQGSSNVVSAQGCGEETVGSWCGGGVGGSGGGQGKLCSSCEARAIAVRELLTR